VNRSTMVPLEVVSVMTRSVTSAAAGVLDECSASWRRRWRWCRPLGHAGDGAAHAM